MCKLYHALSEVLALSGDTALEDAGRAVHTRTMRKAVIALVGLAGLAGLAGCADYELAFEQAHGYYSRSGQSFARTYAPHGVRSATPYLACRGSLGRPSNCGCGRVATVVRWYRPGATRLPGARPRVTTLKWGVRARGVPESGGRTLWLLLPT